MLECIMDIPNIYNAPLRFISSYDSDSNSIVMITDRRKVFGISLNNYTPISFGELKGVEASFLTPIKNYRIIYSHMDKLYILDDITGFVYLFYYYRLVKVIEPYNPYIREFGVCVSSDGRLIYYVGGIIDNRIKDTVMFYDVADETFHMLDPLPIFLVNPIVTSIFDYIEHEWYLIVTYGYSMGNESRVFIYYASLNSWDELGDIGDAIDSPLVSVVNNDLIAIGPSSLDPYHQANELGTHIIKYSLSDFINSPGEIILPCWGKGEARTIAMIEPYILLEFEMIVTMNNEVYIIVHRGTHSKSLLKLDTRLLER